MRKSVVSKIKESFLKLGMITLSLSSLLLLPVNGLAVQKTPADYASHYDQQLPKPRKTLDELRMDRRIRQGKFARQLIYSLEFESRLPLTASEDDAIKLLNSLGISPLKGWDRYAPLTEDDYTVVIGKSIGKEYLVHEKAQEVCDEVVKLLNVEWALYKAKHGRYSILEKLILDKSVFPKKPECPYGVSYTIGGYKPHVLPHRHIIKTSAKKFLFQERDYLKEAFGSKKSN